MDFLAERLAREPELRGLAVRLASAAVVGGIAFCAEDVEAELSLICANTGGLTVDVSFRRVILHVLQNEGLRQQLVLGLQGDLAH